ncbi:MAG TPA: transglutaminase-like domain-containing protein, partial [Vicinamibacteria bacterium]|nr:transglutaminase-like domain-containing protein [Vicinamibacteria bacterium]
MIDTSRARRLGPIVAAVVCLLGAPSAARADDPRLRELDAVLAALEEAPTTPRSVSLAPLVAELERRDTSRRTEFAAAESRKLTGKAADRLARARRAYEVGHGRLLQLVRSLQANTAQPVGQPAFDRGSAIREAREILARIAKASEPEPISTASLSVAAPVLLPLLGQGAPSADRPIDAIPETLKAFAATLDGPVAVYEWVRNNVRPDFYYGVLKGPVQAYLEQSANDADTATLLVALFRAKGVPARYVRGTVEVPAATLQSMTGTGSVTQAVRVLERAGVPHEVVLGASAVSAVRMERVWAEVYLPYANYRGTSLDAQGKVWVPLDPGFKQIGTPGGIDVVSDLGLDPRETLDAYLSGAQDGTPLEYLRNRVGTLVAEQRPGTPYADVLARRDHILETLGLLPSSLPYRVTARPEVGFELPDTLRHSVRLVGEADTPVIDVTLPTADVLGHRLTLSYVPATDEDAALAKSYGGIARTPPYLIEVRPVIKTGGVEVAVGSGPIGMGVRFTFRIELRSPGGTQVVTNNLIAGNLTAIGLGGREVTATEADQDQAAQILSRLAWAYLDKWNQSDAELSRLLRVVPVRPTVSTCLVMSDIQVDYAGGDPLYPITFDWRGLAIDADHRATAPVGLESVAEEKSFLLMSGLEGSVLEHRIFEDELGVASVSTAKGLGLAHAQGIEIADLTSSNADAILSTLPFDLAVKDDIRQATARGLLARVPTAPLVAVSWRGVPYLLLDEETGEAAYQLQGGRSGGVTVATVIEFPAVLQDNLELQGETPAPETSDVARIQKFGTTDFQEGTVN